MLQKSNANLIHITVISSTNPKTLSKQYELIDEQLQKTTVADMSQEVQRLKRWRIYMSFLSCCSRLIIIKP